ncbi:hypothetical protein [Lysobacter humi (ex Lee et al. 2017)]
MATRARSAVVLALLAAATANGAAQAQSYYGAGRVEMSVVDRDEGDVLPEYRHRGQTWVPGTPGHRYAVRLTNRSPERVLVVLSVDGVNAVSGQTADPSQAGYVLEPWQTTEVAGWRKSMRDVAQFYFSDFGDSYATRTGRPRNVGVIGIAVFDEARRIPPPRVYSPAAPERMEDGVVGDAASAPSAPAMARSRAQELGTGHGYREYSPVGQTGFRRAGAPVQVTEIRYDDGHALAARGIAPRLDRYDRYEREPRAFPRGFVPDPPRGW